MFTYIYTELEKCPNVKGWWLKIEPDDLKQIDEVHGIVSRQFFMQSLTNPHTKMDVDNPTVNDDLIDLINHPVVRGGNWLVGVTNMALQGKTILVNKVGGWSLLEGHTILATKESEDFNFPDDIDPDEIITISRWPEAQHWYLKSSKNRLFDGKFNSEEEATEEALKHVPESQIHVKTTWEKYHYRVVGD